MSNSEIVQLNIKVSKMVKESWTERADALGMTTVEFIRRAGSLALTIAELSESGNRSIVISVLPTIEDDSPKTYILPQMYL